MTADQLPDDMTGLNVTVMGLGRFGGGVAATRFLTDRNATVTVTDLADEASLAGSLHQLRDTPIARYQLGAHVESDFADCDLLVVNPAVPPDNCFLNIAMDAGVQIESEITLFCRLNPAPVVAVTGSNGKSTTTALISHLLQALDRRIHCGGNIGSSLLPMVDQVQPDDVVVLELSSFQLYHLDRLRFRPAVAVVTSFAANHLDWHKSLDHYRRAKQVVTAWQQSSDTLVVPAVCDEIDSWMTSAKRMHFGVVDTGESGVFCFDGQLLLRTDTGEEAVRSPQVAGLRGQHNEANMCAAVAAAAAIGLQFPKGLDTLSRFETLPHRLQYVASIQGRAFFNDSISTTPESTIAAVESFDSTVVLLGGYDKQVCLKSMAQVVAKRSKAAVLMGQTAETLRELLLQNGMDQPIVVDCIEDAVKMAYTVSRAGDTIVLSPGCASYDWFTNFEERGQRFVTAVNSLATDKQVRSGLGQKCCRVPFGSRSRQSASVSANRYSNTDAIHHQRRGAVSTITAHCRHNEKSLAPRHSGDHSFVDCHRMR